MKLAAIINPMSRSVPQDAAGQLKAAVRDAGHELVHLNSSSDDLLAQVREVTTCSADAVIAWGGDGTLACALTASGQSGLPVLALPGGTMNMLPRRLHGEGTWDEVLHHVLVAPEIRTISAGEAGDHRFYVAALFGRLTGFAETREAVRKGEYLDAAQTLVTGNVLDVETRFRILSHQESGDQAIDAVAAAVVLSGGRLPAFEVAAIDPESTLDLLSTALDAMIHGWKNADQVVRDVSADITIQELSGSGIPVTLDGEQVLLEAPVRIRMVEQAAQVLCAGEGH